jgi:membrane protease YdiL (CAAX protease family)
MPAEAVPCEPPPLPRRPWGFWATMGFALLIAVGTVLAFVACLVPWQILSSEIHLASERLDVVVEQAVALIAVPPALGLIFLFAWLRRKHYPLKEYLGLGLPSVSALAFWLGVEMALWLLTDIVTYLLGRDIVPPVMVEDYKKAFFFPAFPLLLIMIVLAYPLLEEFFFRGFLLEGFRHSFMGPVFAVLVTAGLWAITHQQYDWYGILTILAGGIVLGIARLKTGSIWVCIAMHATGNFVATIEAAVKVHLMS